MCQAGSIQYQNKLKTTLATLGGIRNQFHPSTSTHYNKRQSPALIINKWVQPSHTSEVPGPSGGKPITHQLATHFIMDGNAGPITQPKPRLNKLNSWFENILHSHLSNCICTPNPQLQIPLNNKPTTFLIQICVGVCLCGINQPYTAIVPILILNSCVFPIVQQLIK